MIYEYNLTDHLGNTRITFGDADADGLPEILQENHYYPFGMAMTMSSSLAAAPPNNYLYNGKELQDELELNWHDFGARMYDASIGRWNGVDVLSEKTLNWSVYTFCHNSPIVLIDPDGMSASLNTMLTNAWNATDPGKRATFLMSGSHTRDVYIESYIDHEEHTYVDQFVVDVQMIPISGGNFRKVKTTTTIRNIVGNYESGDPDYYDVIRRDVIITKEISILDLNGNTTCEEGPEVKICSRGSYTGSVDLLEEWTEKISTYNSTNGSKTTWNENHWDSWGGIRDAMLLGMAAPVGPLIWNLNIKNAKIFAAAIEANPWFSPVLAKTLTIAGFPMTVDAAGKKAGEIFLGSYTPDNFAVILSVGLVIDGVIVKYPRSTDRRESQLPVMERYNKYKSLLLD